MLRFSARQRQLRTARKEVESILAEAVYQELAVMWRELFPHLRRLARQKPATPVSKRKMMRRLRKTTFLGGTALWDQFQARLESRLTTALQDGTVTLAGIHNVYQQHQAGHGYQSVEIIPEELVEQHKAQIGQKIKDITDKTQKSVARRVSEWYNTPETTLGDLVDDLQPTFGEPRARTIAITETTWLNSRVIETRMEKLGLNEWWWQTMRDEIVCKVCSAKHGRVYKRGDPMPPDSSHPNCIVGGTMVSAPTILRTYSRWYDGDVVEIETISGNFLTVTENHPILTPNGWVAAGQLDEGFYVFQSVTSERDVTGGPYDQNSPARIEDVIETFSRSRNVRTVSVPTSPEDFHGDGKGSDVCIIRSDSLLGDSKNVVSGEEIDHLPLVSGLNLSQRLPGQRSFDFFFDRDFSSSGSLLSRLSIPGIFLAGSIGHHQLVCFGFTPNGNPGMAQSVFNAPARTPEFFGDRFYRDASLIFGNNFIVRNSRKLFVEVYKFIVDISNDFGSTSQQISLNECGSHCDSCGMENPAGFSEGVSSNIKLDRILKISRRNFSGHVYNLETVTGWYIANNIITHNCRCNAVEIVDPEKYLDDLPEPDIQPLPVHLVDAHDVSIAGDEMTENTPVVIDPIAPAPAVPKVDKKKIFAAYNAHKGKSNSGQQLTQAEIDDALVNAKAFWGPNTNPTWLQEQQKQLDKKVDWERSFVDVWQKQLIEDLKVQNSGLVQTHLSQFDKDKIKAEWFDPNAKDEMVEVISGLEALKAELEKPVTPKPIGVTEYVNLKHKASDELLSVQQLADVQAFAEKTWPGKPQAWISTQMGGQLWVEPVKSPPKKIKTKKPAAAPVSVPTPTAPPSPAPKPVTDPAKPKPVWETGQPLNHDLLKQVDLHNTEKSWHISSGAKVRYGAVLVDDNGRVLLREPRDHFDGYAWTFAKGGADYSGEHPIDVIEREVLEETGHEVEIIGLVPGGHTSGSSTSFFALARSKGYKPDKMDSETVNTVWATREEAEALINQSTNAAGRKRDLGILNAALAEHEKVKAGTADYSHLFAGIKPPEPPKPKYKFTGKSVDLYEQKPDFPADVATLQHVKGLGGSTGASLVRDPATGRQYVMKRGKNDQHLMEESHADAAYRAAGLNVPEFQVYQTNGGPVKLSHYVDNARTLSDVLEHGSADEKAQVKTKLQQGFAMDALMGNWDVIGMNADNILVDGKGEVWRIDNGGSLRTRAQGQPKGADWNEHPTELWTMRGAARMPGDKSIEGANTQAVKVFGDMTYKAVIDSAREVVKKRDAIIAAVPEETREQVIGRLDNLDHLIETHDRMSSTQWSDKEQDHFGRGVTEIRRAGITERSARKFTTTRNPHKDWDVALKDENGKAFDKLRGSNSLTGDIYSLIDKSGGNRRVIEDWLSDQAGNSWNQKVMAVKYWIAKSKGENFDDYWWGEGKRFSSRDEGIKRCRQAYEESCAMYGAEVFDRSLRMYHAFTYEYLSKAELPNKSADGHRIKLIRTESSALVNGIDKASSGDQNVHTRRGACESCSIVNPVFVEGQEVLTQDVNITDILATYLTSRHAGSSSCALYGDHENEFITILGRTQYNYHGSGRGSYKD